VTDDEIRDLIRESLDTRVDGDPDWQAKVWKRIEADRVWWRRAWRWLRRLFTRR